MYLELDTKEWALLTALVESRVQELHSEIRRSRNISFHDALKEQQESLERLLHRLQQTTWDVTA